MRTPFVVSLIAAGLVVAAMRAPSRAPGSLRAPAAGIAGLAGPIDLGPVRGFVANHGQWPAAIRFAAANAGRWLHVTEAGFCCGGGEAAVSFRAVGAGGAQPAGVGPTGTVCNFVRGRDRARDVVGVPVTTAVRTRAIAPGIDLVLRLATDGGGTFAYDLAVAPGADLARLELAVDGAARLAIDAATGELVVEHRGGELRHTPPVAWLTLDGDGERLPVPCRFELRGGHRFGFAAPPRPVGAGLHVDPDLRWSTTFGGAVEDSGAAVAAAANGDTFVCGTTMSTDLPAAPAVFGPVFNGFVTQPWSYGDAFVARFAASNGALLWCTYLGGAEYDVAVAAAGIGDDVVVTGWTSSTDFPTTPGAFDTTHNGTGDGYQYGGGDVFVTRLAGSGQVLVWSSFLGGSLLEYPTSLAVDAYGEVAVAGHVHSANFPTTPGAFSATRNAWSDFFVSRFAANGQTLVGSTYCGGSDGEEYPFALAIAPDGDIVAGGATDSTDLPVTAGAYDTTYNGGSEHLADGFAMRFDRTCSVRRWGTYLGTPANEYPRGVALHADGTLTFSGQIDGPGLPTTPSVAGPAPLGGRDGFLWRLSGDGAATVWASYFGGTGDDHFERAVDAGGGRVAVAGGFRPPGVVLTRGAWLAAPAGHGDGWLVIVGPDGATIDYATAIGGNGDDAALDVQRLPDGDFAVAGTTWWGAFPVTPGGSGPSFLSSAFAVRLAGLPLGVVRHGAPSGACGRAARIRARAGPFVGDGAFALTCGDLPAGAFALAGVAAGTAPTPLPLLGIDVWLDPLTVFATPTVAVPPHGCAVLPVPVPANAVLAGTSLAVQFVFVDACPALSLGASDAVAITIQP